jgi:hypothetical protein
MDKGKEDLIAVYTSYDPVERAMIEAALRDAEIEFAVHDHEVMDYLQSTELDGRSQILVLEEDMERAQEIVAEIRKNVDADIADEAE